MKRLAVAFPIVAIGISLSIMPAKAGACGDEIAHLETVARTTVNNPAMGPTANQTVGAQLGYQPTQESVKLAKARALAKVDRVLRHAKALDAAGKEAKCMRYVEQAKFLLGM
jgi:hypothetical protein